MIDRNHDLPVTRQARLLGISRGAVYYLPKPVNPAELALMRRIDELHRRPHSKLERLTPDKTYGFFSCLHWRRLRRI
jgi:DNA-binding response OmpR family regulator